MDFAAETFGNGTWPFHGSNVLVLNNYWNKNSLTETGHKNTHWL